MKVFSIFSAMALLWFTTVSAPADEVLRTDSEKVQNTLAKAIHFLRANQSEDGSFSSVLGSGVTGVVLVGLLQNDIPTDDPMVAKGLAYLQKFIQPDGAIYREELGFGNYETSMAAIAFSLANKDGQYEDIVKNAEKCLRDFQWDETESIPSDNVRFGGAGYGKHSRPDLSNTGFMLDALHALGIGAADPSVQKALTFVSRCQNLESAHNTQPFAAENNDGGFIYTPVVNTQNMTAEEAKQTFQSYGSMTYVGFKSMLYAGLTEEDSRVQAALQWLSKHYTLQENPGMGAQGLYYYYVVLSKSLQAYGKETFSDAEGKIHDWRHELLTVLIASQQADGSWLNEKAPRWMENNAMLVTGYALMTLSHCRTPAPKP